MKKFLYILFVFILLVLLVAVITKPGYDESYNKVQAALEAAHHKVAVFLTHDKENAPGRVVTSITVKDRIFYREVWFAEFGKNRKVAIAAFTRIFLLNPTD